MNFNFIFARLRLNPELLGNIATIAVLLVVLGLMSFLCYYAFFAPLARQHAESEKLRTHSRRDNVNDFL